eukprot:2421646-Rhodomonas_salina.3
MRELGPVLTRVLGEPVHSDPEGGGTCASCGASWSRVSGYPGTGYPGTRYICTRVSMRGFDGRKESKRRKHKITAECTWAKLTFRLVEQKKTRKLTFPNLALRF